MVRGDIAAIERLTEQMLVRRGQLREFMASALGFERATIPDDVGEEVEFAFCSSQVRDGVEYGKFVM